MAEVSRHPSLQKRKRLFASMQLTMFELSTILLLVSGRKADEPTTETTNGSTLQHDRHFIVHHHIALR
jgi:hypothetical protein